MTSPLYSAIVVTPFLRIKAQQAATSAHFVHKHFDHREALTAGFPAFLKDESRLVSVCISPTSCSIIFNVRKVFTLPSSLIWLFSFLLISSCFVMCEALIIIIDKDIQTFRAAISPFDDSACPLIKNSFPSHILIISKQTTNYQNHF